MNDNIFRAAVSRRDVHACATFIDSAGDVSLKNLVKQSLVNSDYLSIKFLWDLAWIIFVERQRRAFGENPRFALSEWMILFQESVYELDVFLVLKIPYGAWGSLVKPLSETIFSENSASSGPLVEFKKDVAKVKHDIFANDKYRDAYLAYTNGAL